MKRIIQLGLGVALVVLATPVVFGEQLNEGNSPSGHIHFAVKGPEDDRKIFLSIEGHPQDEVVLCETPGWGNLEIHFSTDEYWIAVGDGGSSLGISVRLFRRETGATYKELKDVDVGRAAELAALKQANLPAKEILDHRYVKVLAWSEDSKKLVLSLSGHGGDEKAHIRINRWIGVYDLGTGAIEFDLGQFNKDALNREQRNPL